MNAGSKKPFIIIVVVAVAVIVVIVLILVIRGQRTRQNFAPQNLGGPVVAPAGVVKDANTRTGVLSLNSGDAKFTAAGATYDLFIGQAGQSSKVLKDRGLKTGDTVTIIGKVSGTYIEVAGISY